MLSPIWEIEEDQITSSKENELPETRPCTTLRITEQRRINTILRPTFNPKIPPNPNLQTARPTHRSTPYQENASLTRIKTNKPRMKQTNLPASRRPPSFEPHFFPSFQPVKSAPCLQYDFISTHLSVYGFKASFQNSIKH